jgi:hypothetical protein
VNTQPAKTSPLGMGYHYHETGDGPDVNTTDSAIDDGPHDHGFAVGPNEAIPTGKGTGPGHSHSLKTKGLNIRPGLGDKVNELRGRLAASAKLVSSLAAELHSSALFHNNANHSAASWRKCKSWICNDAREFIDKLTTEIPELQYNPHALRQYRANVRRLQKAIQTPMQPVVAESLLNQRSD